MDTFRILMVLPSVFTRGCLHFGPQNDPGRGGSRNPLFGVRGDPPHPPGGGGGGAGAPPPPRGGGPPPGGGCRTPPGGGTPPSRRGGNPGQKGPPPRAPFLHPKFVYRNYDRGSA